MYDDKDYDQEDMNAIAFQEHEKELQQSILSYRSDPVVIKVDPVIMTPTWKD